MTQISYTKEEVALVLAYKFQGISNTKIAELVFDDPKQEYKVRRILARLQKENPNLYWKEEDEDQKQETQSIKEKQIPLKDSAVSYHHQYLRSLEKSKQRLQDTNNDLRKLKRQTYRQDLELENVFKDFLEILDNVTVERLSSPLNESFVVESPFDVSAMTPKTAVIQLSDLHFGEGVSYEGTNGIANMEVTALRLSKYAEYCLSRILTDNVKKVVFAFTGDMVNSDRRLDEVVTNVSSRTKSALLGIHLLKQFIQYFVEVLPEDISFTVASVVGNESRLNKEFGWTDFTATDNFDYIIHNVLAKMFANTYDNLKFAKVTDCFEQVISIADGKFNLLITHGNNKLASKCVESEVQKIIGRYAVTHKIKIDYVIFGHIHSTEITDYYARSASIIGGNGYSTKNLNFISKPSQNFFIVDNSTGEVTGTSVPLQNTENVDFCFSLMEFDEDEEQESNRKPSNEGKNTVYDNIVFL